MNSIIRYMKSLLLIELFRGLAVTQKYFFQPKFTIHYPEEKSPQSSRMKAE